ncbi:hypothetical protein [Nocardia macrotermitis]|uniref:hypothetical protein n=1 Tax=Nocardia macrotermitis TaxID=2585198 RepID=UPI001295547D|nr:hypothetical protein [Nocardia macrotermitis]
MLAVLVLSVVVGLLVFGWHRFQQWRFRTGEARRIAEAVTVSGAVRTAIVDVSDGDNLPTATVYFIGPAPKPNPVRAVSVPTIQLVAVPPPSSVPEWDETRDRGIDYAVATGRRPDGCYASVVFVSNPKSSVPDLTGEHSIGILTASQLADIRSGAKVLTEVNVGPCGS